MKPVAAYCFGGPMNERMVVEDRTPWYVVMPDRRVVWKWDDDPCEVGPPYREVCYSLEWVVWKRFFEAPCWVAEGYPMHRITDGLNTIAAIMGAWHRREAADLAIHHPPLNLRVPR